MAEVRWHFPCDDRDEAGDGAAGEEGLVDDVV